MQTNENKTAIEISYHEAQEIIKALKEMAEGCYVNGHIADLYECLKEISKQ